MEEEKLLWFVGPNWQQLLDRPISPPPTLPEPGATEDAPPILNQVQGRKYVYGFLITDKDLDAYCRAHPIRDEPVPVNDDPFTYAMYKQDALELLGGRMNFDMYVEPQSSSPHCDYLAWFVSTRNGVRQRAQPPTAERLEQFSNELGIACDPQWHDWGPISRRGYY
ncbi:hypothetical protein FB45DRAFT_918394 [Roridomyces roridus]|uniref:Uncharacterized protein n=1 Tax=Roridomyces roridus TaxID=1738132 RepID=A0AAD7BR10_9AGAR|nr:hypothetical protein FB45DRAFT_918394 [Roridomyces roridus]